jgi:leucine dehydrogenase
MATSPNVSQSGSLSGASAGIFQTISTMGHEQVVFAHDKGSGLKAVIAIHDTTLGPALGGTRMWDYAHDDEAIIDALRLSRGMTYKAAVAGLSLGGGKAVIIGDPKKIKSEALFRAFGRFIQGLRGRYITAEDVNITPQDMDYVAMETRYVSGLNIAQGSGDPSPLTALGVFHGIRAAVKFRLGKEDLRDLKVAIQGCGAVGSHLCQLLTQSGAKLVVADLNEGKAAQMAQDFQATVVPISEIHRQNVDVFAPCALGAILNDETIPNLKAKVIAGAANNQLLVEETHGLMLRERGILYAPDYVVNAGGLINVFYELKGYNKLAVERQVGDIYTTLLKIFQEAEGTKVSTHRAADALAERRIQAMRQTASLYHCYDNQPWLRRDM